MTTVDSRISESTGTSIPTAEVPLTRAATFRSLVKLAVPLIFVQVSMHLTGLVDTALIGRVDELSLAATGLGASIFFASTIFGLGLVLGLDPLVSQALGAGHPRRAHESMWQGIYCACMVAIPLSGVTLLLAHHLEELGVVAELAEKTRIYVWARLPSLWPFLAMICLRSFLQAAHVTSPIVWSALVTNVFNFIADLVLIYGDEGLLRLGLPAIGVSPMGVVGVGLASTAAAVIQLIWMARGLRQVDFDLSGSGLRAIDWGFQRKLWRIGGPVGLQLLAEVGVFTFVQVIMGGLGTRPAASHQVALMLVSQTFSVCLGIGAATSVQVGRAVGSRSARGVHLSGTCGMGLAAGFMACMAAVLWLFPQALASLLTNDAEVIAAASELIVIAGFFQIVDGVQAVGSGALRGVGATRWAFVANVVGHWGVGLPAGLALCFWVGLGPAGLWWGLTIGLGAVAVALAGRFFVLSEGPVSMLDVDSN